MSTFADSAPVSAAALWAGRLLSGLAIHFPLVACVVIWGELYFRDGGLHVLLPLRRWSNLFFFGVD